MFVFLKLSSANLEVEINRRTALWLWDLNQLADTNCLPCRFHIKSVALACCCTRNYNSGASMNGTYGLATTDIFACNNAEKLSFLQRKKYVMPKI